MKPWMTLLWLPTGLLPAQDRPGLEAVLRDGTVLQAQAATLAGERLELTTARAVRTVPLPDLLAVHGSIVASVGLPAFHIAGSEVVRGQATSGDPNGEWVGVTSPVLGELRLSVDRLQCIVFRPDLARAEDLRLPEGVREGIFTTAAIGFDILAGTLHEIGSQGVRFQPKGDAAPRWYRAADLVGLRLGDPVARTDPGPVELLTRTGDRLRVKLLAWSGGRLGFAREGGAEGTLRETDLACATFLGGEVTFLSALEPARVDEAAWDGPALYPFRRDQSAAGTALVSGGRACGSGLGVHSRSRLWFTVPEGAQGFFTRVGIDDSALALGPRAHADARVLLDGKVVFEALGLGPGETPRSTGVLPVRAGALLELQVDFGKGRDLADRVDWLLPVFLNAPGRE